MKKFYHRFTAHAMIKIYFPAKKDVNPLLFTRKLDTSCQAMRQYGESQDFSPMHRRCILNGLKSLQFAGTCEL